MSETDEQFVERIGNTPLREIGVRDGARLFAIARRGAAVQAAGWQRRQRYGNAPTIEAEWTLCHTREATDPFARVPGFEYRPIFILPPPPAGETSDD